MFQIKLCGRLTNSLTAFQYTYILKNHHIATLLIVSGKFLGTFRWQTIREILRYVNISGHTNL